MSSDKRTIALRLATPDEVASGTLQTFDYTKMTAVNMCPTWGIIRYGLHRQMPGNGSRAMALEAGSVMHECFAAIRLLQVKYAMGLHDHADWHGRRLLRPDRWDAIAAAAASAPDVTGAMRNGALEALATSGYVDDPTDKYRTYTNLETSLLYYVQRWSLDRYPVWITDFDDPTALIGVEIPFAVHVQPPDAEPFLYTGRIDGLHVNLMRDSEIIIQENKTAARLNEAWHASFDMSHQVTGYMVAGSLFTRTRIDRGLVIGLSLPLPRDMSQGLAMVHVRRRNDAMSSWMQWMMHTVELYRANLADPLSAPKYTHSCNRYFRPCSFIPLCASDRDEQEDILNRQMETNEWSPLHETKDS